MDWSSPFIIYRLSADGKLQEVFHAADLKKAKYWLQYIAKPGDVLCKTPVHPKHSKKDKCPEYWCHKEQSGTPLTQEETWKKYAASMKFDMSFPQEQQLPPEATST